MEATAVSTSSSVTPAMEMGTPVGIRILARAPGLSLSPARDSLEEFAMDEPDGVRSLKEIYSERELYDARKAAPA